MTQESIWIGNRYSDTRVFVLGESWYGAYEGDLATDAGWIQAYLEGRVTDRMYSKVANSCAMSRESYWHDVAFTNFVQCVGDIPSSRPSHEQYLDSQPRLRNLLTTLSPRAVWILGEEQARYSRPVVDEMKLISEVCWHPSRVGVTNERLAVSWRTLVSRISAQIDDRVTPSALLRTRGTAAGYMTKLESMSGAPMTLHVSDQTEPLAVKKFAFPKAAPVYEVTINGKKCQAVNTQGGSPIKRYTYFIWDGVSYYVSGHISALATATLERSNVVNLQYRATRRSSR